MSADKSATALRIRNNQRRSRANRKEYIASLEHRLAEYAAQGIQATVEMQAAARAVATENQRLRLLLDSVGVSQQKVEEYLQSFHNRPPSADAHVEGNKIKNPSTQRCEINDKVDVAPGKENDPITSDSEATSVPEAPDQSFSEDMNTDTSIQTQIDIQPRKSGGTTRLCSSGSSSSPTLETPCEMAASIILRMRGQDDESAVYSRFGCENGIPQGCKIRNTILFQLMDEM